MALPLCLKLVRPALGKTDGPTAPLRLHRSPETDPLLLFVCTTPARAEGALALLPRVALERPSAAASQTTRAGELNSEILNL